jgi:hypothetical protein
LLFHKELLSNDTRLDFTTGSVSNNRPGSYTAILKVVEDGYTGGRKAC